MRFLARFLFGFIVILMTAGAGVYFFHRPLIVKAAESVLAAAGFENPQLSLGTVSLSRLTLERLSAGPDRAAPVMSLNGVGLDFDWRELIFKKRAKALHIAAADFAMSIGEDGAVVIAGYAPLSKTAAAAPPSPPIDKAAIDAARISVATPNGRALLNASGILDFAEGGRFEAALSADAAGFAEVSVENLQSTVVIDLAEDGTITTTGKVITDLQTSVGAIHRVDADLASTLASWRSLFQGAPHDFNGSARIAIKSSRIIAAQAPGSASPVAADNLKSSIGALAVAGVIHADITADGVAIRLEDGPLTISADRGDRLEIEAGDALLFEQRGAERRLSVKARLDGPTARGTAMFNAMTANEIWRFDGGLAVADPSLGGVNLGPIEASFDGEYDSASIAANMDMTTTIRRAVIDRLRINDMPLSAKLGFAVDLESKQLAAAADGKQCLRASRADFVVEGQDLVAGLVGAEFCSVDAPLLVVDWSGAPVFKLAGELAAKSGRFRLGKTVIDGAPPTVRFTADHDHAAQSTILKGRFDGGAVALNQSFKLSKAAGAFEGGLVGDALILDANIQSMRIAQASALELVAPVSAAGGARLAADVMDFEFNVATPSGTPLGHGVGSHQVKTGRGQASFTAQNLVFTRRGLQPEVLMPALLGIIFDATGGAGGEVRFSWTPAGMESSADIGLANLSFGGPGVAVTRTEGLDGAIEFSSLSPVATKGEQRISIRKVDLDALKLENGQMHFELPGDDTLKVIEAEFPWFGGTIGAYDTVAPLSGGQAVTRLQIANVNLGDVLAYLNIDGLSGEGVIEGVLPLSIEAGKATIKGGVVSATGPGGAIRYVGAAADAAQTNSQSQLAFDVLRELRFDKMTATIDGPLDGELIFKFFFEGYGDIPVVARGVKKQVNSPVIYRITVEGPLLSLYNQVNIPARVTREIQIRARQDAAKANKQ